MRIKESAVYIAAEINKKTNAKQIYDRTFQRVLAETQDENIKGLDARWSQIEKQQSALLANAQSIEEKAKLRDSFQAAKEEYKSERKVLVAMLPCEQLPPPQPFDANELLRPAEKIETEITRYTPKLSLKRSQLEFIGEYGDRDSLAWFREIRLFIKKNPIVAESLSALHAITSKYNFAFDWDSCIGEWINESIIPATTFSEVSQSDGIGFERYCHTLLLNIGWSSEFTKTSGDQGVDIVATKNGIKVAVQCKNYSAKVGNSAVQEVFAGKGFYEADYAAVLSPSGFTASAFQLAQKIGVILLDPESLSELDKLIDFSATSQGE